MSGAKNPEEGVVCEARRPQDLDRRREIGGDGLVRVVRARALPAGAGMDVEWFMDYCNADGSVAAMCGNGLRPISSGRSLR